MKVTHFMYDILFIMLTNVKVCYFYDLYRENLFLLITNSLNDIPFSKYIMEVVFVNVLSKKF